MRYKDVCKWLKKEAKKLPDEGYFVRSYYFKKPETESDIPHFLSEDQRIFMIEEFKANHARRLKRIWKRTKSFVAINDYFLKYNMQLLWSA